MKHHAAIWGHMTIVFVAILFTWSLPAKSQPSAKPTLSSVSDLLVPSGAQAVAASRTCFRKRRGGVEYEKEIAFDRNLEFDPLPGTPTKYKLRPWEGAKPLMNDVFIHERFVLVPCGDKEWKDIGYSEKSVRTQVCRGTIYAFRYEPYFDKPSRAPDRSHIVGKVPLPPASIYLCDGEVFSLSEYVRAVASGEKIVPEINSLELKLKTALSSEMQKTAQSVMSEREALLVNRIADEVVRRLGEGRDSKKSTAK